MAAKKHFTSKQAGDIGKKLGIDWSRFDVEQFRMGLDVELEHGLHDPETNVTGDDPILTGKIAYAHLKEFPDYYTRLAEMERQADEQQRRADAPERTEPLGPYHPLASMGVDWAMYLNPMSVATW